MSVRRALARLKAKFIGISQRSHWKIEHVKTAVSGYASQVEVDKDRTRWGEINRIPDGLFTKLFMQELPDNRNLIHASVISKCHGPPLTVFAGYGPTNTIKYIGQNTTIPVPQIFAYSPTVLNDIGFPYIIMSRLPGNSAHNIWYDQQHSYDAPNQMHDFQCVETEQKRLNFLRSLAIQMTKLKELPFNAIVMPTLGNYEKDIDPSVILRLPVDKTYVWPYPDKVREVVERPVLASTQVYIEAAMARQKLFVVDKDDDESCRNAIGGIRKIIEIVFSHPVFPSTPDDTFLQHNDIDLQNILTDDCGNGTGTIDWDGSIAVPRCVGHSAAPNFLRRDWFPDNVVDRPHLLFRAKYYREIYSSALFEAGNSDAKYTTKSAIYQAAIAFIHAGGWMIDIMDKILQEIGFQGPKHELKVFYGSPQGSKADEILKTELYKVLDPVQPTINLVDLQADLAAQIWLKDFDGLLDLEIAAN